MTLARLRWLGPLLAVGAFTAPLAAQTTDVRPVDGPDRVTAEDSVQVVLARPVAGTDALLSWMCRPGGLTAQLLTRERWFRPDSGRTQPVAIGVRLHGGRWRSGRGIWIEGDPLHTILLLGETGHAVTRAGLGGSDTTRVGVRWQGESGQWTAVDYRYRGFADAYEALHCRLDPLAGEG